MMYPAAGGEAETPDRFSVSDSANATDDLFDWATRVPRHPLFARKVDGRWTTVGAAEFARQVTALAAGLIASGVRAGDRIALMSGTSYEWVLCDYAIWTAGAVTVPIYDTSSASQVAWLCAQSGARRIFVADGAPRSAVRRAELPPGTEVWPMTAAGIAELVERGADVPANEVTGRRAAVTADSPATIVYTSGTTGRPKGCLLRHRNLVAEVRSVAAADGISDRVVTARASILLFLPLAHILARVVQLVAVHNGALTAHTSDLTRLTETLADFRPSLLLAVPRVFEKLYNGAVAAAADAGRSELFRRAESTAVAYSESLDNGGPNLRLRVRHRVFDRLVYAKLRAATGGRVRWAVSGGAPLTPRIAHVMRGAGITVLEGWGLSETTAGVTLNLPDAQRIGTVGRPLPGAAVRIAPDGEVLVKGPTVFAGYWRDEAATAAVFDPDGWFRTGDLGRLDDGFLTVTGRKKDLIVTASGKNVAPAYFEDRLRAHWLIDQCVLVGDNRPYVAALITLDPVAFPAWKREHGRPDEATIAELRADVELIALIQEAIDEVNATVSKAETVKRFRILAAQFELGEELTPSQTVRRTHVLTKFGAEVEELYAVVESARP